MDTTAIPSRRLTTDRRYSSRRRHVRSREGILEAREERPAKTLARETGNEDELRRRSAMRNNHHMHHRRAAQADVNVGPTTKVLTVNVEVIATVDSSGNVVGQETKTQDPSIPSQVASAIVGSAGAVVSTARDAAGSIASPVVALPAAIISSLIPSVAAIPTPEPAPASLPQVPSVPPFPSVAQPTLPSVPAVPQFPSGFGVPTFPFASSAASALALAASTASPAASSVLSSRPGSVTPAPSAAAASPALNSTMSSNSAQSGAQVSLSNSASTALSAGSLSSMDSISATMSSGLTALSRSGSATGSPTGAGVTAPGGFGVGSSNTAVPPSQATGAAGANTSGSSSPLPTPQVVGSVVGSLAGLALILAVVLLLLRRHKRKRQGTLQLTEDDNDRVPAMTQDTSRNNRIPSAFLHRFSGMSRSTADTSTSGGERSFQRVSGRKLPSAFSEGMTSEQFSRGGTMSGSSFYQDDQGTYGGPGVSKEFGKDIGGSPIAAGAAAMNIRPSPARTPIIRHPDDDANPFADPAPFPRAQQTLSPPQSPNPDARKGTLGRSLHSYDGSRSSKFTENV